MTKADIPFYEPDCEDTVEHRKVTADDTGDDTLEEAEEEDSPSDAGPEGAIEDAKEENTLSEAAAHAIGDHHAEEDISRIPGRDVLDAISTADSSAGIDVSTNDLSHR